MAAGECAARVEQEVGRVTGLSTLWWALVVRVSGLSTLWWALVVRPTDHESWSITGRCLMVWLLSHSAFPPAAQDQGWERTAQKHLICHRQIKAPVQGRKSS